MWLIRHTSPADPVRYPCQGDFQRQEEPWQPDSEDEREPFEKFQVLEVPAYAEVREDGAQHDPYDGAHGACDEEGAGPRAGHVVVHVLGGDVVVAFLGVRAEGDYEGELAQNETEAQSNTQIVPMTDFLRQDQECQEQEHLTD